MTTVNGGWTTKQRNPIKILTN